MQKVRKAVFPVAGMGTRFLPATKASPKEMLPIVDTPLIQYAVEEAVAAGITDMVFVPGRSTRAIEDHCAKADELLDGETAVMKQMTDTYDYYRCSVLGVQDVPRTDTKSYGIVDARKVAERVEQVNAIVEKPKPEDAPSTLAVVGRYILTPRIFHHLENIKPGAGGEIQLTDGIASLLGEEQVLAYRYEGIRYDCGSKPGYLQATVDLGRRHPEVGAAFDTYLKGQGG